MVGLTRLELVTSPLSGVHSNQLSYRPSNSLFFFYIASASSQTAVITYKVTPLFVRYLPNLNEK